MHSAWAVIPARGGSKGIPGKNLQNVGGRSLVRRAVEACEASASVSRTFVSTDSEEIAREALVNGAEVVDRPASIAGDTASSESAVLHALDSYNDAATPMPMATLLVQCTSPFVMSSDLDGLVGLLDRFDSALAVAPSHRFLWRADIDGSARGVNHEPRVRLRRQDLDPEFVETGMAYAMRTAGFLEHRHRFFGRIGMYPVEEWRALEIDSYDDLEIARAMAAQRRVSTSVGERLSGVRAVIFDFDGVMTDDRVFVGTDGTEVVAASRSDGMGVAHLRESGYSLLILSKERNAVVSARAAKLSVEAVQGCDDKRTALSAWLESNGLLASECAYVGNDVNDLECLQLAGVAVCPADARPEVRVACDVVLGRPGGRGAVRELADLLLATHGAAAHHHVTAQPSDVARPATPSTTDKESTQ